MTPWADGFWNRLILHSIEFLFEHAQGAAGVLLGFLVFAIYWWQGRKHDHIRREDARVKR